MTASHTIDEVTEALRENHGIVLAAARKLGVTRHAVEKRIRESATLQQVKAEARESIIDMAESALVVAVTKRDPWAVQFVLRTLGRDRGYADRIDIRVILDRERERVREAAEAEGLDADLAVAEFERMIKDGVRT